MRLVLNESDNPVARPMTILVLIPPGNICVSLVYFKYNADINTAATHQHKSTQQYIKGKDNVVPVHAMMAYTRRRGTAPLFRNLGISWR